MIRIAGLAGVLLGLGSALWGVATAASLVRRPGHEGLAQTVVACAAGVVAGAVLAFGAMEAALITDDFTLAYVAEHHSTRTPFPFDVATLWAALEGSILLWVLVLAGYVGVTVHRVRSRLDDQLVVVSMATLFVVCVFFFGLLAGPANPFGSFDPPVGFDGPGPNPLLQNHILMAFHPPLLYLGYVGFTVPFAFAVGALATGRLGEGWLVETRRWTLFAWACLTAGIVFGSWWSYEVLGWGGYWAWDPVENASLLPWLTGTAYLHSVMVQERRAMLRVWNLSLLCATFALTILGTFLTRSGVLDSVHAFSAGGVGGWLLGFFALVVAVTIGLLVWRGDTLASPRRITAPVSREAAFLANNVVFAAFAFTVLLGTVFPLLAEAFQGERITVGSPFFNRMSVPVGLTLLVLMAVAPVLPWGRASAERVAERLQWPAWAGGLAAVGAVAVGNRGVSTVVAFALGGFAAGAAVRQLVLSVRRHGARGLTGRSNGGMVVHLGVVAVAVAVAASQSYVQQTELRLDEGASADFAGHTLTYVGPTERIESARTLRQALVLVDGHGPYAPGEATFPFGEQRVGVPSVRTTLTDDIALSVLAWPEEPGGAVTIRVTAQPLIVWLWIGGGIMVLGTALAIAPHRRPSSTGLSARDDGADGDLAGGTESADRAVSTTVGSDAGAPSA